MSQDATTADRFARDTKTHRLEIAQDQGPYRHLKFRAQDKDGRRTGFGWFDLITTPGTLIFTGDYDSVVFRRTEDMFDFFRRGSYDGEPNFGYWAEKVASGGPSSVQEYSEEVFEKTVKEQVVNDIRDGQAPRGIGRAVHQSFFAPTAWEYDTTHEAGARDALNDFEYEGYRFGDDAWELDFTDYTHHFRWACHAIVLGIRLYDQTKATSTAAAA